MSGDLAIRLQAKIDGKTKPPGALGELEALALKIGLIQQTLTPSLHQPTLVVFAGDHGIAAEGVSAFPAEVTAQMVANFAAGGAAVNVFARSNGLALKIVDAGVAADLSAHAPLIHRKIRPGTSNSLHGPAMTAQEAHAALAAGAAIIDELHGDGSNVVGLGEMGIANTSAAAMIMALLLELPVEQCTGAGTGVTDGALARKIDVLTRAVARAHQAMAGRPGLMLAQDTLTQGALTQRVLEEVGGFEIGMMAGAMARAAHHRMVILIDGFIATAALLLAKTMDASVLECCVFCHQSDERGHRLMLEHLDAPPLLKLGMRLGEGTGAALAFPLIRSAVAFLNEMASFEEAGISG
ncbi:MAG: nicotinate-nucleotide--dimethylbenzimidazole phosphoribosyltransferase [Gammaproteobacteria bacterium]|nr:nicotinate-nucleotide--dimethylbenzimidazole phosphoribosyltransferase [Gammaproteobacteria bacterium]